jgi:predicted acetyltransferase
MIEFASKKDFKEIIKLWVVSFGDSEAYVERFLNTLFKNNNCLVYRKDSRIVSMLFLLDAKILSSVSTYSAYYIYAACTSPDSRGMGIMANLMKYTVNFAKNENKDFLCLVPANEHLFDYYSHFGFKTIFKRKEFTLSRSIMNQLLEDGAEIYKPVIKEVKALRDEVLSTGNSLRWEEDILKYAIEANGHTGGRSVFARKDGKLIGYAVYRSEKDIAIIQECCVRKNCFGLMAKMLADQTDCDYFQFSLSMDFPLSVDNLTVSDNGMMLPLNASGMTALDKMFHAFIGFTLE